MREAQILIQCGGDPNFSRFDATMLGRIERGVIGCSMAMVKIQSDGFKQRFLIAFDGKVIVCVSLFNQVTGQFALGQQGIGRVPTFFGCGTACSGGRRRS